MSKEKAFEYLDKLHEGGMVIYGYPQALCDKFLETSYKDALDFVAEWRRKKMEDEFKFGEQVSKLHAARQLVRQCQIAVDESYEEWRAANGEWIARAEQAKLDLKEREGYLRLDIVEHYEETGDKKPHPKLGVRVLEVPVYKEGAAINFAVTNVVPTLLKLDKVAFKSYAKGVRASAPLPFVEWEEKVTATIAGDLE
jgi:hypothetical protein